MTRKNIGSLVHANIIDFQVDIVCQAAFLLGVLASNYERVQRQQPREFQRLQTYFSEVRKIYKKACKGGHITSDDERELMYADNFCLNQFGIDTEKLKI